MKIFKRILPDLVILIVFIIASAIYFWPALEGKVIFAGDNINATSAIQEGVRYHEQTGDYTYWTDAIFSGMPNYQIGGNGSKVTQHTLWIRRVVSYGCRNAVFVFFYYLIAFYLLFSTFKINRWVSMAGAFATSLSSYFFVIVAATHGGKTISITFMTLVLIGFMLIYQKKYLWGAFLTIFFICFGFFSHPQMSYYICMLIGMLFFAELAIHWKERRWKDFALSTLVFVVSFGIGMGCGSANVFANTEYAEQTMRGGHSDLEKVTDETNKTKGLDLDYATAWSYGIDETLTLLIPNFEGGASGYNVGDKSVLYEELVKMGVPRNQAHGFCQNAPTYRGEKAFTSGAVYAGAIVCFLFILGLLLVRGPYKWALLAATLFSIFLAWGHHFMWLTELFFKYFPMYNKFRAVESILIVAEITMPLLGFLALKSIADKEHTWEKVRKALFISGGITAGICLIVALAAGSINVTSSYDAQWMNQVGDRIYDAVLAQRRSMIRSDAWRSLLFVLLGFGLVWEYTRRLYKKNGVDAIKLNLSFGLCLTILIVADMWPVDKRFCNDSIYVEPKSRDSQFVMEDYERELLQDTSHFRVLNLATNTFNENRTGYYLKSIGGYHAAKLRRYQDLIDQHISREMNPLMQDIYRTGGFSVPHSESVASDFPVLNMLNMKYAIVPLQNGGKMPIENPYAMGNAWFVDSLVVVDNANEESDALRVLDLHRVAVLDKEFAAQMGEVSTPMDETASIELVKYTPKYIDYVSNSSIAKTAVFSEIYYPYGWKVFVDNEPAEHYRVNYMLRALNLPGGRHTIHFVFDPDSVRKGNRISMICFGLMTLTFAGALVWSAYNFFRRRKKTLAA